ncbi:MAG TPA: serine/threonine-protein kinase, partial [Candidatus Binatia bacterium]|nr:serine/threonine-protein kinase [Candidatus Binatia bacterium]
MLERLGPYTVVREMAEDRFGQVFEAIDTTRRKRVVIKSLRHDGASRPEIASRLYSEAQTLALLNHPHIARLFGFIRVNNKLYLVMEFVEGESLRAILRERGRLHPNLALAIFQRIVSGVKFAHELGVIHGELKSSSVMVANFAQIKILDFAIAPILGNLKLDNAPRASSPYLAPELISGQSADVRTDIFSLGVLLYETIAGKVPFSGNAEDVHRVSITPPSTLARNCPGWLDEFLLRSLAPLPGERFQSVAAMCQFMAQAMAPGAAHRVRKLSAQPVGAWMQLSAQRMISAASILRAGAQQMAGRLSTELDEIVETARRMSTEMIKFLQGKFVGIEPWRRAKDSVARLPARTRTVQSRFSLVSARARVREKFRQHADKLAEYNWERYAVLATLLLAVLIETFMFGSVRTVAEKDSTSIAELDRIDEPRGVIGTLEPRLQEPV